MSNWETIYDSVTRDPRYLANLFSAFLLIEGCTAGKDRGSLQWFFGEIEGRVESSFGAEDIW